jgi:EF hand
MKTSILTTVIALGVSAAALIAQEFDGPPGPRGQGGPGGQGGLRQGPPIMIALDTNKDGKLDATEIANAAKALKTLDKNGDGELTQDEIGGPRRGGGPGGPGEGPGRRQPPIE